MLVTTLYLASAAEGHADPYAVLGSSADERLALAALADLALSRVLQILPEGRDESPDARGLAIIDSPPPGLLSVAVELLRRAKQPLDVDRGRRALRDVIPEIEAELIRDGSLVEDTVKGVFKTKTVRAARPDAVASAQLRLRTATRGASAVERALVLIATSGLSVKRMRRLFGGEPGAASFGAFEDFDPGLTAHDGAAIGPNGADLLGALTTVALGLADSSDSLND